jgi:hypothetical protein
MAENNIPIPSVDTSGYKYDDVMRALANAESSGNAEDAQQLAVIANTLIREGKSPKNYGWEQVPVNALLNYIPNAIDTFGTLIEMGLSPVDTANALADVQGSMLDGTVQKLFPKFHQAVKDLDKSFYNNAPEVYKFISNGRTHDEMYTVSKQVQDDMNYNIDKITSQEGIKRTLAEKPFDVALTISGLAGATKKMTPNKTFVGTSANKTLGLIEKYTNPLTPFTKTGQYLTNKALTGSKDFSKFLMATALKPTKKDWQTGKAQIAINTLLENDIPLNAKGQQRIEGKIGDINEKISQVINDNNIIIDKDTVLAPLKAMRIERLKQARPKDDIGAIDKAIESFYEDHPGTITIKDAQEIKQGTYKFQLKKAFGEQKSIDTEIDKALARGFKEQIESVDPNIKPLNAQEGDLFTTLRLMDDRLNMEQNKGPFGISTIAPTQLGFTASMLERYLPFKDFLARKLYNAQKSGQNLPNLLQQVEDISPTYKIGGGQLGLLKPEEEFTSLDYYLPIYPTR